MIKRSSGDRGWTYFLISIALALWPASASAQFVDPAPPQVHEVQSASPAAVTQEGVTFHVAPATLPANAIAGEWPWLLGPTHDNRSAETRLLAEFPPRGPARVWEVSRGSGYAAPAVAAGRLVHFHRVRDEEVVECLDALSGKRFWRVTTQVRYEDRYGYANGPRCSPIIRDGRVYTYGVSGTLQCLDLATGQVVWRRDILTEFKLPPNFFGVGASPLLEGELLIVNIGADEDSGSPTVAGFERKTGRMVWGAGKKYGASYASPVPATIHGKRRVLVFAGGESAPPTGGLMCIDPANGKVDFEFSWRSRQRESVNASSPVVIGNRVFISECYGRGSVMLDIRPDFTPSVVWENEDFGTHFMTAIHQNGYLYGIHGHGPLGCDLVCLDAATGKIMWRHEPHWDESIPRGGVQVKVDMELNRSQLIHADGKALCLTENGHLLWLDLNPKEFRQLSRAFLFLGDEGWTGPVLSNGLLYVCRNSRDVLTNDGPRLICYDLRGR